MRINDAYAQHAAVSIDGARLGQDIAPTDDRVVSDGDKLRLSGANVLENELPHRLERWGLEKSQEAALPSHAIHGCPETLDVLLCDGNDAMGHRGWPV